MNPWTLRALDVLVALLLVGGIALIWRSLATRHLSFAARVAQGRVSRPWTHWDPRANRSRADSPWRAWPQRSASSVCAKPPPASLG